MSTRTPAKNIDEVIARLTDIIDISRQEPGRMGYFAALYRKVTINVKQGILNGRFEDGARMERLDVNFANRYLEAYELHRKGESRPLRGKFRSRRRDIGARLSCNTCCWASTLTLTSTWGSPPSRHLPEINWRRSNTTSI